MVKHRIDLIDDRPFKQPYHAIRQGVYEEVRQHIKDMQSAGVIRESNSIPHSTAMAYWYAKGWLITSLH